MYLVNSNLAKSNSFLTRTKLVSLDRNLPQSGKSAGCGYTEDVHRGYRNQRGFSENKGLSDGLGGVFSLAGSKQLHSSLVM